MLYEILVCATPAGFDVLPRLEMVNGIGLVFLHGVTFWVKLVPFSAEAIKVGLEFLFN